MIRRIQIAILLTVVSFHAVGCASARIEKLIKNLRDDLISENGSPSPTMTQLAEYGADISRPVLDSLTSDEREYNISLVMTLTLVKEGIEPEVFADLIAHPGRGVAETAQKIILNPKTRNLTDRLSKILYANDPGNSGEPRHASEVYRRVLACLSGAGRPPAIPVLLKAIKQRDAVTRRLAMQALTMVFARYPYTAIRKSIDSRYYQSGIYFILRTVLRTDTDAEVRYHASRALEAFLGTGFGYFAKTEEKRDKKNELLIIDHYDQYVVWQKGLVGYQNYPGHMRVASMLRLIDRKGKLKIWRPGQRR